MLCPYVLQPSFAPLVDLHWPVGSLWPQSQPLLSAPEMLLRNMQEMRRGLSMLEKLEQQLLDELYPAASSSLLAFQPLKCHVEGDGDNFAVTLDTEDFAPEELSVKQVGRKLQVSGKMEKKQEDGKVSYSYRRQEFRQDLDLPEGVNPQALTCSFSEGKLHIRAPREALPQPTERMLPINTTPAVSSAQESGGCTHGETWEN